MACLEREVHVPVGFVAREDSAWRALCGFERLAVHRLISLGPVGPVGPVGPGTTVVLGERL